MVSGQPSEVRAVQGRGPLSPEDLEALRPPASHCRHKPVSPRALSSPPQPLTSWPVCSLKGSSPGAENSKFKAEGTVGVGLDMDGRVSPRSPNTMQGAWPVPKCRSR